MDNIFDIPEIRILKQDGFFGVTLPIGHTDVVPSTAAFTFFCANRSYKIIEVKERHETANVGAYSLQIKKVPSGTAIASGTNVLTTAFDLTASAATTRSGVVDRTRITGGGAYDLITENQSLAFSYTGVAGAIRGVHVSVLLKAV